MTFYAALPSVALRGAALQSESDNIPQVIPPFTQL